VQLKQVLEDLSSANVQLTRLNQLAHGLREAAESARRAKEEFVANVSHELRTPLNMIIGFSRMIVQTPQVYGKRAIPPALLSDLTVILRNSQHLSSLVDDVLDLSQIEADKMALTKERTDLKEIVETAVTVVRPLFESKHFYLESEIEEGLPPLLMDRTRIREVLLNLLSNAGRFTEQGGVKIRVGRSGNDVLFSVADTGPGIASADMSKLFQPFQQLDDSLSRRHEGTGLGLTLSKRFVELHGGKMWLESNVGQGSTFFFTLPLDHAPAATGGPGRWLTSDWSMVARTRPSLAPAVDTRPRFVVLDEVGTLSRLVTRYLDGCEIVTVPDLPAAIQELAQTPAQALLVADPGALSWSAHQADSLISKPPVSKPSGFGDIPADIPVILCPIPIAGWAPLTPTHPTPDQQPNDNRPSDPNAISDYLVKPISQEALLAAVTNSLAACGLNPDDPATILLVDDEPDELRLFWRMLAATNRRYRILTAGNGVEALAVLREERPDVVVSDLMMPEMDGFQLVAAKNSFPELRAIPLVIISARDPQGQPIVAESVTAIRAGGLSIPQLLASVEALSKILSPLPVPAARRPS
jgi:CheY-like chemotaxis protein/nitrogen-specific signal transduction histidine kinase